MIFKKPERIDSSMLRNTKIILLLLFSLWLIYNLTILFKKHKKLLLDPAELSFYQVANQKYQEKKTKFRVILFGDSRIYQWNPLPLIKNIEIINRGINGQTTGQAILRIQNDVINLNPDLVIIELGINDLNTIGLFPEKKQKIVLKCKKNLRLIIDKLEKHNVQIIMLSIFQIGDIPFSRKLFISNETRKAVEIINTFLQKKNSKFYSYIDCNIILAKNKFLKKKYREIFYI